MTHSLFAVGDGDLALAISQSPAIPLVIVVVMALLLLGPFQLIRRRVLRWPAWLTVAAAGVLLGLWALRLAGVVPGVHWATGS